MGFGKIFHKYPESFQHGAQAGRQGGELTGQCSALPERCPLVPRGIAGAPARRKATL